MPIPLQCDCGRSLRVKDDLAGRKVKCPQCAAVLLVPRPEPAEEEQAAYEVLSDGAEEKARPRARKESADEEGVQPAPRPRRSADEDDEDDPEVRRRKRRRREEEAEDEDRRRERRRKDVRREVERAKRADRAERARYSDPPRRGGFGTTNAGVVGGLIMVLIAVVWLGLGLMAGRIFFFPPVLLILGIIAIAKGAAGR